MSLAHAINEASAAWLGWVIGCLLDGTVAFVLVALGWSCFGKQLRPRLGAWLFTLVLLKCAVPFPVALPMLPEPLRISDATLTAQGMTSIVDQASGLSAPAPQVPTLPASEAFLASSWLLCLWITIMIVGLLRVLQYWCRTRALVLRTLPADEDVLRSLEILLARPGTHVPAMTLRVSRELRSPAVAGWWRPVLILPEELVRQLSPAQFRWAVSHELAHIRSHDVLWQWVELLLRTVLWFHPAVWLATRQASCLRERACDEEAVEISGTSRQQSAEGFLALIEWSQTPAPILGLSLGHAGREARARIRALTRGPRSSMTKRWQCVLVATAAGLILPSYRLTYAQSQTSETKEDERVAVLEKRVAELEQKLQAKSRLEALQEKALLRAHQRAEADSARFTTEELREIERLYQGGRKSSDTAAELEKAWQPLIDSFPQANRTGCALLLLARQKEGAERKALLLKAATEHGDAYFGDATSVGGVARLLLARDADAAGRTAEAQQWRAEIRRDYADDLDFGAVPLLDLLDAGSGRQ